MSERSVFYNVFTATQHGRPSVRLADQRQGVYNLNGPSITIGPGKSGMLQLDDHFLAAVTDAKFLALEADQEGAYYWIIDSPTPAVDPDTRLFGYLLDTTGAPIHQHTHGFVTSVEPNGQWSNQDTLDGTGSNSIRGTALPAFQTYTKDITTPSPADRGVFVELIDATGRARKALDMSLPAGSLKYRSIMSYIIGAGYFNLGTNFDSLAFYPSFFIEDTSILASVAPFELRAYCWPFSDELTDPTIVPTQIPDPNSNFPGVAPFSAEDPHFERMNGGHGWEGLNTIVFIPTGHLEGVPDSPASWDAGTVPSLVNGLQSRRVPKSNFTAKTEGLYGFNLGASPVWNRITAFFAAFRRDGTVTGPVAANECYLCNIWFGAPFRYIRPFHYSTHQKQGTRVGWSTSCKPAIGIQNPLTVPVTIRAWYGAL